MHPRTDTYDYYSVAKTRRLSTTQSSLFSLDAAPDVPSVVLRLRITAAAEPSQCWVTCQLQRRRTFAIATLRALVRPAGTLRFSWQLPNWLFTALIDLMDHWMCNKTSIRITMSIHIICKLLEHKLYGLHHKGICSYSYSIYLTFDNFLLSRLATSKLIIEGKVLNLFN